MSIYRNVVWFTKGMMEYTKPGYESASKAFVASDLEVDLTKRSIMITGANSGIGKVTALEVAKRGATVYMVCRSKERGEAAQKEIIDVSKNSNVFLHIVDMSQPRQVSKFAKEFLNSNKPLSVLVNNAGCMINERTMIEDLEANFATNTLGTHILTKTLLPLIGQSEQPRVIIVSSGGMLTHKLDWEDLNHDKMRKFDGTMVYAQNKRQQVVMADYFARHNPKIYFATMHPGWSDTPAVQTSMPSFREKMINKLRTPEQGADTLVWMCCVNNLETKFPNGSFFQDRVAVPKHLPLAWTQNSIEDENKLMKKLDDLYEKYSS